MPKIVDKGKGALSHKIGPLPLWGWAVGGAAALFVLKKMRGSGSGSALGGLSVPIASLSPGQGATIGDGSLASGGSAVGSPNQNAMGGMDTQPGGTLPPWWSRPNGETAWLGGTPNFDELTGKYTSGPWIGTSGPSTNGSAGHAGDTGTKPATFNQPAAPSTVTTAAPSGGIQQFVTKLADAVFAARPKDAQLVAPTTVSQPQPDYTPIEAKQGSMAYDPVYGLYDTAAINAKAYAEANPGKTWVPYNGPGGR